MIEALESTMLVSGIFYSMFWCLFIYYISSEYVCWI